MQSFDEKAYLAARDKIYLEQFIAESESFILRQAYYGCGHAVDKSSDEWSVSLIAFAHAIERYEPGKGSFAGFASLLIRSRLIDHFRCQSRHFAEVQTDPEQMKGLCVSDGAQDLRYEIEALNRKLCAYGISFFELEKYSPKKRGTRRACGRILNYMAERPELCAAMRRKKALPVSELEKNLGVHRKIMERHRKYLITAVEILDGDYPELSEYLVSIRKEGV